MHASTEVSFKQIAARVCRSEDRLQPANLDRETREVGPVAKFWRLPRVEHAGRMGASEPEVADDPERPGREAEAPGQGRFQGPALRSIADPAGGLVVPPLPAQLP